MKLKGQKRKVLHNNSLKEQCHKILSLHFFFFKQLLLGNRNAQKGSLILSNIRGAEKN